MDYSRPGFAVVYRDEVSAEPATARVSIREAGASGRLRFEPSRALSSNGGSIAIENESSKLLTISDPSAQLLRRLGAGERYEIAAPTTGLHRIHVLDAPGVEAAVFVAPGAASLVSEAGRFELRDLPTGATRLRVWHALFPPALQRVVLSANEVLRLDLEVGLGAEKRSSP